MDLRRVVLPLAAVLSLGCPQPMQAAPGNPTAPAGTAAGRPAPPRAPEPDPRRLIGAWALTDNRNNLFNVRLFASGRAVSTIGTAGVPPAGTRRLTDAQQRQLGRWQAWGNGVRVDYSDGWTDWIYVGPSGLSHASWPPGEDRGTRPFNHGPAVQLQGRVAEVVGVYSFPPAQAELKPYTATLLSNGQAFNNLDAMAAGVWTLKGSTVVIDWISGWRTTMSLDPATRLQLRHWAPGTDRRGPASGPVRQGSVIE